MVLNVVFGDEVGDGGGVVDGGWTATVDGGVDEEFYVVFKGRVDEGFALSLFGDCVLALSTCDLEMVGGN